MFLSSPQEKKKVLPSTAGETKVSERVSALLLPIYERPRMPFTQDKYVIKEDPHLVQWERVTREFLRRLSLAHGHRVSAVMIFEWATGISVAELQARGGSANKDLRIINKLLRHYFGDTAKKTHIAGRPVYRAYRVRPGHRIKARRPLTNTLYAEYCEGVLNPWHTLLHLVRKGSLRGLSF